MDMSDYSQEDYYDFGDSERQVLGDFVNLEKNFKNRISYPNLS